MGPIWGDLGPSSGHLGPSGGVLGSILGFKNVSFPIGFGTFSYLGLILGDLVPSSGHLGPSWGGSWAIFRLSELLTTTEKDIRYRRVIFNSVPRALFPGTTLALRMEAVLLAS